MKEKIKVKVLLGSWFYGDKYVTVDLSVDALKRIIKLFNSRTFGPTVDDLCRVVYWELQEQGYNLDQYHVKDVELVEE
jgi:hypothetical protein